MIRLLIRDAHRRFIAQSQNDLCSLSSLARAYTTLFDSHDLSIDLLALQKHIDTRIQQRNSPILRKWSINYFHRSAATGAAEPLSPSRENSTRCWNCDAPLNMQDDPFFCPSCNTIQPVASVPIDYYTLFTLPEPSSFSIDLSSLEFQYKSLQRRLHPDVFSLASPREKEYSAAQASLVNQAYDILKKPLKRAHYLLSKYGVGACEGLTIKDADLLEYVMDARELVESTENKEELKKLRENIQEQEGKCINELEIAFQKKDFETAAEHATILRYLERIKEAITEKL